ncbi:hypothetical protein GCM10010885_21300 [Alicyclobacillus cellulosilyticus]|uniref:Uncharacterized protein n=1 Tax=Alicyclobacillus cellulosilyticus TaxID=1003997 RepID=A0A917NME7_9BACL|nr:hypothetical protein [Alicyclobacillus cellulosilyticus]GGJ11724.1 hypothetical protein GCM10010885_21300 [Alicyclobacillus cellulosilyticus]
MKRAFQKPLAVLTGTVVAGAAAVTGFGWWTRANSSVTHAALFMLCR